MGDYLLRIGKDRWPIIGVWPCPPFMSDGVRIWRGLLEFKQFRVYLEYSENDNPHMFVGKDMQGIRDPGSVKAIDPPNRVEFTNAGMLKVRMVVQQMADHPLTAAEIALLGPIFNSIEEIESAKPPIEDAAKVTAVSSKVSRKQKDVRPRWGKDERGCYEVKIQSLISDGESNREIAKLIPTWAEANAKLKPYKMPSASTIQKWAAMVRGKKRRKRAR